MVALGACTAVLVPAMGAGNRCGWAQAAHIIDQKRRYWSNLSLARRECMHAQGVNIGLHQVVQHLKYHAMALDSAHSLKSRCNNLDLEVAFSIPGTRVACVQVALVLDQYILG